MEHQISMENIVKSIYKTCMEYITEAVSDSGESYARGLYDGRIAALRELKLISDSEYEAYYLLRWGRLPQS